MNQVSLSTSFFYVFSMWEFLLINKTSIKSFRFPYTTPDSSDQFACKLKQSQCLS